MGDERARLPASTSAGSAWIGRSSRISTAVANYVGGALAQATIAGLTSFVVMKILGIPFAAPLAVLVGFADLIPLVGATIAAILVGIVTVFADFPIDTIIWAIWAIVYQQLENTVIQPQIQRRAVDLHPFLVLVSVLFGSTLFGVAGALLAIPAAASVQIALGEWWHVPPVRARGGRRGPLGPQAQKSSGRTCPVCSASAKRSMRSSSTLIASASAAASIWAVSRSSAWSSGAQPAPAVQLDGPPAAVGARQLDDVVAVVVGGEDLARRYEGAPAGRAEAQVAAEGGVEQASHDGSERRRGRSLAAIFRCVGG